MLTVYLITAVVGGAFVLLSAFGGSHDDLDRGADLNHDAGLDGGVGDAHAGHGELMHADIWVPFLSMRFWTYFLTFFGVTGLLLTWIWQEGLSTALLSGATGLLCGLGMAYGTRYFKKSVTNSGAGVDDFVGAEGEVVVALSPGEVGKIRLFVKGTDVDLTAKSDDAKRIERGSRVLVIGFDGATARVVRMAYATNEEGDEIEVGEEATEVETRSQRPDHRRSTTEDRKR